MRAFYPIKKRLMIIDGRAIAHTILEDIHKKTEGLDIKPKLCVILVGDSPASLSYIKQKQRSAVVA